MPTPKTKRQRVCASPHIITFMHYPIIQPYLAVDFLDLILGQVFSNMLHVEILHSPHTMRRDGVVVNTLASKPRGPGFNSWSDRALYPSPNSCGKAVSFQLPWLHEVCDMFTVSITLSALLLCCTLWFNLVYLC